MLHVIRESVRRIARARDGAVAVYGALSLTVLALILLGRHAWLGLIPILFWFVVFTVRAVLVADRLSRVGDRRRRLVRISVMWWLCAMMPAVIAVSMSFPPDLIEFLIAIAAAPVMIKTMAHMARHLARTVGIGNDELLMEVFGGGADRA